MSNSPPPISFVLFSFKFLQANYIPTLFSSPIHSLTAFWFHHSVTSQLANLKNVLQASLLSLTIVPDIVCSPPSNFYLKCYHYPLLILFVLPLTVSSVQPFLYPFWAALLSLNIHIIQGSSFTAPCAWQYESRVISCPRPGFVNDSPKYVSSQIPFNCL